MIPKTFTQSPVAVTPKKRVAADVPNVPKSVRIDPVRIDPVAALTWNYQQFLMPPTERTDETQSGNCRVNKNNLIGLHKAKRHKHNR